MIALGVRIESEKAVGLLNTECLSMTESVSQRFQPDSHVTFCALMSRRDRGDSGVEGTEDVSLLFRAIANKFRCAVVRSLDENHMPIPRKALATYVAKDVFRAQTGMDFIEFRDRLLLELHHNHIPKLAEANVIEVESGKILPGSQFAAAVALVDKMG